MSAARGLREKVRALLGARLDYLKTHEEFLRLYLAEYGSLFRQGHQLPVHRLAVGSANPRPLKLDFDLLWPVEVIEPPWGRSNRGHPRKRTPAAT